MNINNPVEDKTNVIKEIPMLIIELMHSYPVYFCNFFTYWHFVYFLQKNILQYLVNENAC